MSHSCDVKATIYSHLTYAVGVSSARPDYFDFSAGGRMLLWSDWLLGFVNMQVPLNQDGFRPVAIPVAGLEAVFLRRKQWTPHALFGHRGINEDALVDLPVDGPVQNVLVHPSRPRSSAAR